MSNFCISKQTNKRVDQMGQNWKLQTKGNL